MADQQPVTLQCYLKKPPSQVSRDRRRAEERRRTTQRQGDTIQVQYYRSVRGTLEPLLTQPRRKSFPFPTNREQCERHKLLREELHGHMDRRRHIDSFFHTLFNDRRHPEPQKPTAAATGDNRSGPRVAGQMNQLPLKMRPAAVGARGQQGQGQGQGQGGSLQHLAGCQCLRVYDWEAKDGNGKKSDKDRKGAGEPALTSWGAAENRLKAGILALDFIGSHS